MNCLNVITINNNKQFKEMFIGSHLTSIYIHLKQHRKGGNPLPVVNLLSKCHLMHFGFVEVPQCKGLVMFELICFSAVLALAGRLPRANSLKKQV